MSRKIAIGTVTVLAIAGIAWIRGSAPATAEPVVEVWRSPSCSCCGAWVQHMERAGFTVSVHDTEDLVSIMDRNEVPQSLGSCHTATVGGYVIEGHVPADLIEKLLRERPAGVKGLAVPGMVSGSPGMEGGPAQHYRVVAFHTDGTTSVYAER